MCTARDPLLDALAAGLGRFLGTEIDASGRTHGMRWQTCAAGGGSASGRWVFPTAGGAPATGATALAAWAAARLDVDTPHIATAPPAGGLQLAGVRVWFWATRATARSATAEVPGLSATVTAEPVDLRLATDGTTIACAGIGTPYRPGADPAGGCTHVFQTRGTHPVTATLRWRLRWRASDGTSGALPDLRRTVTLRLRVSEGRAVTD